MRVISGTAFGVFLLTALACEGAFELEEPRDVMGNFEVEYTDNLRVFVDDELIGEIRAGEEETFTWNGETFDLTILCGDSGTTCPSEAFWGQVAVDQPHGDTHQLINFINVDDERGTLGARLGGLMEEDGSFGLLSGLHVGASTACAAIGVGTVTGEFNTDNDRIDSGVIAYEWSGGCQFGGLTIEGTLRLESDYEASRTGAFDTSMLDVEPPVDEDGDTVEP